MNSTPNVTNFLSWAKDRHLAALGLTPNFMYTKEALQLLPERFNENKAKIYKSYINILYINACSLSNKLINVNNHALSANADIIVITESWHSNDHEYNMDSYNLIAEQARLNTPGGCGGGVTIYAKKTIAHHFTQVDRKRTSTKKYAEDAQICAIKGLGITIWGIYRSPNCRVEHDLKFAKKLQKLEMDCRDIVIGDFNLSTANWITNTATNEYHQNYMAVMMSKGMDQIVNEPTHIKGGRLDLIFVGNEAANRVTHIVNHDMKLVPDHFPIEIKYRLNDSFEERQKYIFTTVPDKDNADYKSYEKEIEALSDSLDSLNSPGEDQDTPAIAITKEILRIHDKHVKTKLIKIDLLGNLSDEIKHLKNRLIAIGRAKSRTAKLRKEYQKVSKLLKIESEKFYLKRQKLRIQKLAKGNDDTWGVMKGVGKPKIDIMGQEQYFKPDGSITTTREEASDVLIDHYCSVTTNVEPMPDLASTEPKWLHKAIKKYPNLAHKPMSLDQSLITEKVLIEGIKKLNPRSAPGLCSLFSSAIKNAGTGIYTPILNLFNNCVTSGVFPKVWKIAWIKSLPKKGGEQMNVVNTRPISIISTLGKLFEICMGITEDNFLASWLQGTEFSQIIPKCQYGFRKGSCCEDNLAAAVHKINHCIENKYPVDVILYDYKKAFDTTTFGGMVRDAVNRGLGELTKVWRDYYKDRYSFVRIRETDSKLRPVLGGCPQGCPRSPHNFSMYISELYPKDDYETYTEKLATTPPEGMSEILENYEILSKFIDRKIHTVEDALRLRLEANSNTTQIELSSWRDEQKKQKAIQEVLDHLINEATSVNRNPCNDLHKDMFVKVYQKTNGEIVEKQSSKRERLCRFLTPSWYADDLKSISIPAGPSIMVRNSGQRKLWPPTITFNDQQSFIDNTEKFNTSRQLAFHPYKCQVIHFGGKLNPQKNYYMKHPTNDNEKIVIEKVTLARDLGLWYRPNARGFLDTEPTFERMLNKANAMIMATKKMLRGAPLERYNLIWHALVKSIFTFASSIWFKETDDQLDKLNKIYKRFFSNIPITPDRKTGNLVLPETLGLFLRKLNLKRCFKIINGQTILNPNDYWDINNDCMTKVVQGKSTKQTIKCWCANITHEFSKINPRGDTRIDEKQLDEYMENRMTDNVKGLKLRLEVASGAYENSYRDWKEKMAMIKQRDALVKLQSNDNLQLIAELTKKIDKSNSAKIINKVGSLNDDDLIKRNKDIRVRTKNKDEFLEMLKRIRSEYEMDDTILVYET